MLTNDEKRMLRVVAAYNDCTEEEAEKAIVKTFLDDLLNDDKSAIALLGLPIVEKISPAVGIVTFTPEKYTVETPESFAKRETPEQPKVRKKPGRKPKTLKEFVDGTAREVRQAEKMSKDEFVDYFGGKG